MKNAQRKPEYSVWYPATSSDLASGKSNGVLFNSATAAIKKMTKPTGCTKMYHAFSCARYDIIQVKLPANKMTPITLITSGIS